MTRKVIIYSCICTVSVLFQLLVEIIPAAKYPLKLKMCRMDISALIAREGVSFITQELQKEELEKLVRYRDDFCFSKNQHQKEIPNDTNNY